MQKVLIAIGIIYLMALNTVPCQAILMNPGDSAIFQFTFGQVPDTADSIDYKISGSPTLSYYQGTISIYDELSDPEPLSRSTLPSSMTSGWGSPNWIGFAKVGSLGLFDDNVSYLILQITGLFDDDDLALQESYFTTEAFLYPGQEETVAGVVVSPVPEPATLLLLSAGLIGLAGYGRKN